MWEYGEVEDRLIPSLLEICTAADGNHYVVPMGIHKTNIILYNIHVFEKYGVAIPDHEDITWDDDTSGNDDGGIIGEPIEWLD